MWAIRRIIARAKILQAEGPERLHGDGKRCPHTVVFVDSERDAWQHLHLHHEYTDAVVGVATLVEEVLRVIGSRPGSDDGHAHGEGRAGGREHGAQGGDGKEIVFASGIRRELGTLMADSTRRPEQFDCQIHTRLADRRHQRRVVSGGHPVHGIGHAGATKRCCLGAVTDHPHAVSSMGGNRYRHCRQYQTGCPQQGCCG